MSTVALTIISLVHDLILLAFSGWWLFNIPRTPYDKCLSLLLLPLLVLILISISRSRSEPMQASLPLRVNLTALVLMISLAGFRAYWDLDFILYGKEYLSAMHVVDINALQVSQEQVVTVKLPPQYRHLSYQGEVYVREDNDMETTLIVFPVTADDLDGLMNAYVYTVGEKSVTMPDECLSGRPVNPHYENWYYCVVWR
jgi:hypothetical protein